MDKGAATKLTPKEEEAIWFQVASSFLEQHIFPRFDELYSERCFGINWETGMAEEYPEVTDRDYPDQPGWTYGTADLVGFRYQNEGNYSRLLTVWVADWKTGGTGGAEEQLLSLLCAVVGTEDLWDMPDVKLLTCVLQVDTEGVWPIEREVTIEELKAHWKAMEAQYGRIGTTSPQPGIHCSQLYCEHLAYCSAIGEVVIQAVDMDGLIPAEALLKKKLIDNPATPAEAADTIELVTAARRQLNYLTECMKEWVQNNGPIVAGEWIWSQGKDGFRWRKKKK